MRSIQRSVCMVALALLFSSSAAEAAKKNIVSNGCTADQIGSAAGAACMQQLDQDLINQSANVHNLFCDLGGGMKCCLTNGEGRIVTCKKARATAREQGGGLPLDNLTIKP